jgi:hypothetical protein
MTILVQSNIISKTFWIVERAGEGMPEIGFQFLHDFFTIHTLYSYVYSVGLRVAVRCSKGASEAVRIYWGEIGGKPIG